MKKLFLLSLYVGLVLPAFAQTNKTLVNLDKQGIALQGYDPVAFFSDSKPVKGSVDFQSAYHGGKYLFATAAHKTLFDANPGKYEPSFGGYCAYGVSKGHLAPVKVDAFQIVGGHLLMQYDSGVRDIFNKNKKDNLAKANSNWPNLLATDGK